MISEEQARRLVRQDLHRRGIGFRRLKLQSRPRPGAELERYTFVVDDDPYKLYHVRQDRSFNHS